MKGWHEAARKAVEQNARKATTPLAKERANVLLQSPGYNMLTTFHDARTERQLESVKYVLLGEDFLRKNLLFAAGAMAAAGPGGVATFGMANALMWSRNLFQVMTNNPISAQPVIDAGVAYVRSHPKSENAADVYQRARRRLRRARPDRARPHLSRACRLAQGKTRRPQGQSRPAHPAKRGEQESEIPRQPGKLSEGGARSSSRFSAAAEATKKLAALAKDENQGMRMSKQFLLEHPEISGPAGSALKASLFDGNPRNMEIADRGVNFAQRQRADGLLPDALGRAQPKPSV